MKTSGIASRPWLIAPVCSSLHATYAALILYDRSVLEIEPLRLLTELIGWYTCVVLLTVALIAMIPMVVRLPARRIHLCLWPQQCMLFISVASIAATSINVVNVAEFIPTVCLTFGHLAATYRNALLGRTGNGHVSS